MAKRENDVLALVAVEAGAKDLEAPIDPFKEDLTLIEGASHAEALDSSKIKRNIVILMGLYVVGIMHYHMIMAVLTR